MTLTDSCPACCRRDIAPADRPRAVSAPPRPRDGVAVTDPQTLAVDTPPRGSMAPLSVPQPSDATQGQPPAQRAADGPTADPQQLTLPPELLAAMLLPAPIPSARHRGRRIDTTPDIDTYQETD